MNIRTCAAAFVLLCSIHTVCAETRTTELQTAICNSLKNSPLAAAIDSNLALRMAEAFTAETRENPIVDFSVEIPTERPPGGGIEQENISLTFSQSLRMSDFGTRGELSELLQEAGNAEKLVELNEFIQSVTTVYVKVWQLQERQDVIQEAKKSALAILTKAKSAANAGVVSDGDIELLVSEVASLEAEQLANSSDLIRAQSEFIKITGTPLPTFKFAKPQMLLGVSKDELITEARSSQLPVQRRFKSLVKVAQKQLDVARLDASPSIAPQLGYGRHDDGTNQFLVGIAIPLPFFNRNQAERMRAEGFLSAAERNSAYANSELLQNEIALLWDASDALKTQVSLFTTGVISAKKRAVAAYTKQFNSGSGNIFQIWQAQRDLNASLIRRLEIQQAYWLIQSQISALLGYPHN